MVSFLSQVHLCLGAKDVSHGGNILEPCTQVKPALLLQNLGESMAETQRPLDTYFLIGFSTPAFLGVPFRAPEARGASGGLLLCPSCLFLLKTTYTFF